MSQRSVSEWMQNLKEGCTSVMPQRRNQSASTTNDDIGRAREQTLSDGRATMGVVTNRLQVIQMIVCNNLSWAWV